MPETLYTVEEAAERLKMHPDTLRRQLRQGRIRSVRTGKLWRIPESVLTAPDRAETPTVSAPQASAGAILEAFQSGDKACRNAAIIQLAKSDAATIELVEDAIEAAEAAYDGPQDDLSDWRALDGEPFHFPEVSADYLTGLYKTEGEAR